MNSLNSVINFDLMVPEQKKLFADDLIKRHLDLNEGPLGNIFCSYVFFRFSR